MSRRQTRRLPELDRAGWWAFALVLAILAGGTTAAILRAGLAL